MATEVRSACLSQGVTWQGHIQSLNVVFLSHCWIGFNTQNINKNCTKPRVQLLFGIAPIYEASTFSVDS